MPHIHELIDFTITPIIVHPDKTKLLLVFHPKYDKWLFIGGHIELDENPDEALYREIKEECGLDVEILAEKPEVSRNGYKSLFRPRFVNIHEANPPHKHVALVYVCLAKSDQFQLSSEHTDMKWCTLDEIKDLATEEMHSYSKIVLGEIGNE